MPKTAVLERTYHKNKFRHEFKHYDHNQARGYTIHLGQSRRHSQLLVLGAHHILKKCRGLEITYYPKDYTKYNFMPKHEFKRGRLAAYWCLSGASREITVWWNHVKAHEPHPLPWYFVPSAALLLLATFMLVNLHTSTVLAYATLLTGITGAAFATINYIRHNQPTVYDEDS